MGSGAPQGNKNALKHGAYRREALERRTQMRSLLREARKLLRELTVNLGHARSSHVPTAYSQRERLRLALLEGASRRRTPGPPA